MATTKLGLRRDRLPKCHSPSSSTDAFEHRCEQANFCHGNCLLNTLVCPPAAFPPPWPCQRLHTPLYDCGLETHVMKLKLVAAISALAIPALAHGQQSGPQPNAPKPTQAEAQKVVQIITSDKLKTEAYC